MPRYTYSAMDRIPESERVRIGYREQDFLEALGCRTCMQKSVTMTVPFMAAYVYFKEYQLKYGHYPILRASALIGELPVRRMVHYFLPIASLCVGVWWAELAYTRCVLGLQGAAPLPDQIIKRNSYP